MSKNKIFRESVLLANNDPQFFSLFLPDAKKLPMTNLFLLNLKKKLIMHYIKNCCYVKQSNQAYDFWFTYFWRKLLPQEQVGT